MSGQSAECASFARRLPLSPNAYWPLAMQYCVKEVAILSDGPAKLGGLMKKLVQYRYGAQELCRKQSGPRAAKRQT